MKTKCVKEIQQRSIKLKSLLFKIIQRLNRISSIELAYTSRDSRRTKAAMTVKAVTVKVKVIRMEPTYGNLSR